MQKSVFYTFVCVFVFVCLTIIANSSYAASSYKLGPGDIITVSIFAGGEEQVNVNVTVSDQGAINAPFVGSVLVTGLSTSKVEEKLHQALAKDYFVNPQVHIQIDEYHSLQYSISGAVKKPGKYEMQSVTSILELIAKAEGATKERGRVAYVMRDKGSKKENVEPIKVNLTKLLDEGDMSFNIMLESGDSIYIPLAKGLNQGDSMVYVAGRVKQPGLQEYQPGLTALSVCIMAGGFDKFAAPNRATIVRVNGDEQEVIKINLEDVVDGKIADIPLEPGDRLNIPESWL